ncbi:protoporphyrinogen/coproporphyrinogen III oxidase [Emericellopsis cladophorae]|uniref:Protoporphyrinogen oxidase n=1 Tax=Emericellopsis cladophorae TaxID=2686198 RepID=A0A9P9Y9L0_9HYPO|nr:protoporphyrinogen/coproporphyrinogen III oxidase [Emericellopsis cladophorae]KAI6785845.1 protoporphyrinogen/coproporphyrinogen III oxidase [Emericellopsis cladophorae]
MSLGVVVSRSTPAPTPTYADCLGVACRSGNTGHKARDVPEAPNIAVVGGGLTGLTTAYFLAKRLEKPAQITVYEASSRWGGWLRSEKTPVDVGGVKTQVLFERGPRSMSTAQTGGRMDRLILYQLLCDFGLPLTPLDGTQPRWILHENQLAAAPPCSIIDALKNPVLRQVALPLITGYLKNLFRRTPYPSRDMSIAEFLENTYGSKVLSETLMSAIVHGVWGGSVHDLSAWSVAPHMLGWPAPMSRDDDFTFVPTKEFRLWQRIGSEIDGVAFMKLFSVDNSSMVSFEQHGMETLSHMLVDALESMPNVELRLGTPATDIAYRERFDKVVINRENARPYDKVISALPAKQLHKATKQTLPLEDFKSVSVMTVNVWYPYEDIIPKGLGYLIPDTVPQEENPERALGVFFDSGVGVGAGRVEVNGERLAERGTKLFVLMGGHYFDEGHPIPTEEEAIQQAKNLLERQLGIPKDTPCHAVANLAKDCLPQHTVGHAERITKLDQALQAKFKNRLAPIGGSFTKPGVAGALRAGYDMAFDLTYESFHMNGLEEYGAEHAMSPSFVKVPDNSPMLRYNAHLSVNKKNTESLRRGYEFSPGQETIWPDAAMELPSGRRV